MCIINPNKAYGEPCLIPSDSVIKGRRPQAIQFVTDAFRKMIIKRGKEDVTN